MNSISHLAKNVLHLFKDAGLASHVTACCPPLIETRQCDYHALSICRFLPQLARQAPAFSHAAIHDVNQLQSHLLWGQTYQSEEIGNDFLQKYGWTEIIGTKGTIPSDQFAMGLLLLAPDTHYPLHRHPAEEYYLPLSGMAQWYDDDRAWRQVAPGELIFHRSNIGHSMRTVDQPLVAAYIWSGAYLKTDACLENTFSP